MQGCAALARLFDAAVVFSWIIYWPASWPVPMAIGAAGQVRQLSGHRPRPRILFGTLSAMATNYVRQEAQLPLFVCLVCRALSLGQGLLLPARNGFHLFVCRVSCLARFLHTMTAKADTSPAWNQETIMNANYTAARAAIFRAAVRHLDARGRNQFTAARQYADGAMIELDVSRRYYEMRQFDTKNRRPFVVEW